MWTKDRLANAGYDVPDPYCQLCGSSTEARDTLFHRLWGCTHPTPAAARAAACKPGTLARAIAAGPRDPLYSRAILCVDPSDWPLASEDDVFEFVLFDTTPRGRSRSTIGRSSPKLAEAAILTAPVSLTP